MNIPLDEVVFFDCITHSPVTGATTDADSTPTFAVYEEAADTDIGVGGNLTKRASLTGNYRGTFTASAANGFEVGKWYSIIVSATVDAIAAKVVAKNFRLVAAEAIAGKPKVDVDAFGGSTGIFASGRPEVNATHAAGTAWNSGAITTGSFASGAINAGAIAANAIGASELASDAVAEIQSGLATAVDLATIAGYIDTEVAAIKAKTDQLTFTSANRIDSQVFGMETDVVTATAIAGNAIGSNELATTAVNEIADGILDRPDGVEVGMTFRQALRLLASMLGGRVSGAGTGTEVFRNAVQDSKDRVTVTVDGQGNRSAVATDLT